MFAGMRLTIPSFNQFIDPTNFFACNEKPPAPMRKTRRNYSFKHASRRIQTESTMVAYSECSLQISPSATLPMDPLHWIILMRSFISARPPALDYQLAVTSAAKDASPAHGNRVNATAPASFFHNENTGPTGHLNLQPLPTMPLRLASPTAHFYALPLKLNKPGIGAPELLDEKFAKLVHKAVFAAHHESGTHFELHRESMSLPVAAEQSPLAMFADDIHIPGFQVAGRRAPFIPDARLTLAPAGFKHASLPDWIDGHHERPALN